MFQHILSILDWIKDKLPIQDRKERWKNELDNLQKERADILIHKADIKQAIRLRRIDIRIATLEQLFRNQEGK